MGKPRGRGPERSGIPECSLSSLKGSSHTGYALSLSQPTLIVSISACVRVCACEHRHPGVLELGSQAAISCHVGAEEQSPSPEQQGL